MKKNSLLLLTFVFFISGFSQDIDYARRIIDSLCSPHMHGRGYVNKGEKIAADFIKNEFVNNNLKAFKDSYFQPFQITVNTLPKQVLVKINGKELKPGIDYLVSPISISIKSEYEMAWLTSETIADKEKFKNFIEKEYFDKVIIIDKKGLDKKEDLELIEALKSINFFKAKAMVFVEDKLSWDISNAQGVSKFTVIDILRESIPDTSTKIDLDIKNKYYDDYITNNVIGYVEGKIKPDSFIVFSAHYDHLGKMGDSVYFPGANDNASGVAMMLDLAKYYSNPENKPEYSIAFISFGAEEIGLLGSQYYCKHPLFSLGKIKFFINLDLVGTGDDGIKVVNGTVFEKEFNRIEAINQKKGYLKTIGKRGDAANSDHYPFYKNNVKSIFIYTLGGIAEYHSLLDKPRTLPLTEYEDLFRLLIDFVATF